MLRKRTQVGIVGAGPAGLMLSQLLYRAGIDNVIVENRSRAYCEGRVRAGLLEQGTIDLINEVGGGARMAREGLPHEGIELRFDGTGHRIDIKALTGRNVMIYGQHEFVKDFIALRLSQGADIMFEADGVCLDDITGHKPLIRFTHKGQPVEVECAIVAGCDGFHGISRPTLPTDKVTLYDHPYPMAWVGALVEAPPVHHELIYSANPHGFALFTMRSKTVSRLYLQCRPDESIEAWSDARIWEELDRRLVGGSDYKLPRGPMLQKSITEMRSFVCEPMQHGNLFLAGDAAHIVPPTGAKGMNLAIADVRRLARAVEDFLKHGRRVGLDTYSERCLKRVWRAQHFSWWMTCLMHNFQSHNAFEQRAQQSERAYVVSSAAAARTLAENYAGMPWEWDEG